MIVALAILLVASLAMMQTAILGMNTNVQNEMRDEAVSIAEMKMNELRSKHFNDLIVTGPSGTTEPSISRSIRAFTVIYIPVKTINAINADSRQIGIAVSWNHKGQTYKHGVMSIISNHE